MISSPACSVSSETPGLKRVTKEEARRAKSKHTVKMMLNRGRHKRLANWTKAKVARDFK